MQWGVEGDSALIDIDVDSAQSLVLAVCMRCWTRASCCLSSPRLELESGFSPSSRNLLRTMALCLSIAGGSVRCFLAEGEGGGCWDRTASMVDPENAKRTNWRQPMRWNSSVKSSFLIVRSIPSVTLWAWQRLTISPSCRARSVVVVANARESQTVRSPLQD